MRQLRYRHGVTAFLMLLVFRGAIAQESPEAWVSGSQAPYYFAVLVEDVDRSVDWYRDVFGLRELDDTTAENGAWRIVNLRNEWLFVEIIRDNRAREAERPRGLFKVGFGVPDVESVADRVEGATQERPRVVDDAAHGIRILQLRDPEGSVLQLFSPLENQE